MHSGPWPDERVWDVCERFARFGVPLHFTELTILSGREAWDGPTPWPSTPEGEARQAREATRIYTHLFSHPAVEAITWWDFSDRGAWKQAPAGLLRQDMTPKPVYDALADLIRHRWWTKEALTTGENGEASFRGFLGDYTVTIAKGDRGVAPQPFSLGRRSRNHWVISVSP
jgi:hypothetical protein